MKLIYFYLGCNLPESQCNNNLDGLGGGCAQPEEPTHVATGPDIGTY